MNILEFLDRFFTVGGSQKRAALYTQGSPFQFVDDDEETDGADRGVPMSQYDELLESFAEAVAINDYLIDSLEEADARHGALLAVNVALVGVLFILGMTYTLIHLV